MKEVLFGTEVKNNHNPFKSPEIDKVIYTTESQAEIWIACKFGGADANRAYNESVTLVLNGNLNKETLIKALQVLVNRHEALRSVYSTNGKFMTIFKTLPLRIDYKDISQENDSKKDIAFSDYLLADANYIFNLVKGPLFKIGLIKISENEHRLVITAHHIICDGWSVGIMLEELGEIYSAVINNKTPSLPQAETYSSYATEQQLFIDSDAYKKTENYWINQYNSSVPIVTLPTDFPRPELRTFKSKRLDFAIDKSLVSSLKKTGVKSGASFVITLLAAFEVFLYNITGQDDLVVGLPASGQSQSGKTQLVGHCVNLMPLRSKLSPEIAFSEYLKNRKTSILDAYDYQQFSFGQLLKKISITRDPSRIPLVPIMFNIDMGMSSAVHFKGLTHKLISNPREYEAFELFLNATGTEDELILEWSYNAALFKPDTIEKMMISFKQILLDIVENPNTKIGEFVKVDDSEYLKLNNTVVNFPKQPLHQLLSKQAFQTPNNLAIKLGDDSISYLDLEKQSNQLASYLISKGVSNGDFIGVSLPRSIELVVSLVAIMKCGAAYLPLDPKYPSNRLEFMLEDSGAKYLITSNELLTVLQPNTEILLIDTILSELGNHATKPISVNVSINDNVYLLYTSGSTGKPKGVPITHKNLVNFLYSMLEEPGIEKFDKLLSITTISFDIAGLELFTPLLKGAKLILTDEETAKDSRLLLDLLKKEEITILQATPTTWQMLFDAGWNKPLPLKALCGGEAMPVVLAKKILENVNELWNMYGPTETTIWSSVKQISKTDDIITIGLPINNTQIYIVNEQNQLVAPGKIGELCIAGDGVAKGYWKRQDLTSEKFIKNPFESNFGPVLYKTGDLAKLLPSGEIQCLGRIDQQVKIRGHRIELGEIEKALDALEGIKSSVILLNNDNLVASLIPLDINADNQAKVNKWKEALYKQLPPHMVPQKFNFVNEFPTTLNGKIDRKSLLESLKNKLAVEVTNDNLTNSEKIIANIWKECLNTQQIDIHSDFFEIGGHSLIAVKVMTMIEKQTGNRLPLASLLTNSSISKLAAYMDKNFITWNSLVPLKTEGSKPPLFIVHGANYNVLIYKNLAENLDKDQPVYGLQAKGISGDEKPHDSVEAMAAHYISEILTINPNGPFKLAGFSFGGIIAFEMAKQLKSKGKNVETLALFDSYVYPHYYYNKSFKKNMIKKLYSICQLIYMCVDMFSSIKKFKRRWGLLKIMYSGFILRFKYGKEKQYQIQFNRTSKIDEYHQKAYANYKITPENIKIDLFRATENIYFAHDFNLLGWKKIALNGIKKHKVAGNHTDMLLPPSVKDFANKLQCVLNNYD
ncbi:amino acid adenylation domain-containing protein [Seonamhaeicola algicola]|uniref:Amino acid adenylation domain-containing protein n=1 Tax=Seonamhaeicola algicola TaxID=1719036 RepID=A0A5C7AXJ9_9FLAO|nr:non-ribosomal peptide synthetase [Seonamhaeicola algicola]TXE12887.1 amino acid adenylation domain-containing protein [Seonamhaeicola algicola]